MSIEEFYQQLGGNASEVLERLVSLKLITKFVGKFPEDENFQNLCSSIQNGQRESAFLAAHTLKGLCQTLGFGNLLVPIEQMTEMLRPEAAAIPESASSLLEEIRRNYEETVDVIHRYLNQG